MTDFLPHWEILYYSILCFFYWDDLFSPKLGCQGLTLPEHTWQWVQGRISRNNNAIF